MIMWKIVIIDDDRQVLRNVKKLIPWETLDAECVAEAMDGKQGLEIIHLHQPDIVITDIYMPVMNGLDMVETLRLNDYNGKIIILSGYSDFEYARQALRLNVNDYLSKPARLQTINKVLNRVIDDLKNDNEEKIEQKELQHKLMRYEPFVIKQGLISLVTGTLEKSEFEHYLHHYDDWQHQRYLVMGIEMIRNERLSGISTSDWNLFRFSVNNIIKEILNEDWPESNFVELHSHNAAVLLQTNKETDSVEIRTKIKKIGNRIILCIKSYLKIQLHIGVGNIKDHWEDISDSTEEAFQALALKKNPNCGDIFLYEPSIEDDKEVQKTESQLMVRPIKFYQQLADAVKNSREKHALEIIDQHLMNLNTDHTYELDFFKSLGMEIWTIVAISLNKDITLDNMYDPQIINLELAQIGTFEQLGDWIKGKVKDIYSNRQWNENIKHRQAIEFMIEHIHDNYSENINLSDLAEKVFISRNYLSNIFKESTGESFNHYLTRVRMEKARGLLKEGKYMIYEISGMVGYKNVPYFSNVFKKFTGTNPSDLIKR